MFKRKNEDRPRSKKKRLISIICVALATILCVGFVSSLFKDDNTRTISASAFSVGGLDENGKYVENDQAIFTEEAFDCIGLRIKPAFKEKITYDVYYYDYDEKFITARKGLTEVYSEDFPLAKMCRVVIHPEIPEGEKTKDFSINFFEAYSYAKKVTITVDKDQDYPYEELGNLYVEENSSSDKNLIITDDVLTVGSDPSSKISEEIYVSGNYKYYDVFVKRASNNTSRVMAVIARYMDDKVLAQKTANLTEVEIGEWSKLTVEAKELNSSAYLIVRMPEDAECYVFAYN